MEESVEIVLPESVNTVTIYPVKKETFYHELISNGKVTARVMADLYFQSPEIVTHIYVKNGDRVKKGDKIAELDKFKLTRQALQTRESFEKTKLELQDILIGQGYGGKEPEEIPEDAMRLAKIRSGYDNSQTQYELARYAEENAVLVAPFDGIIANLNARVYNPAKTSEAFCSLINEGSMEVEFSVLENELPLIRRGDKVNVTPFSATGTLYAGSVTEINPVVDDKRMVTVKASVAGSSALFEGMNVRVSIQRAVEEQIVVPKSAVVLRSGRQVVFTLEEGRAMWNYVQTGLENAAYYTIIDEIEEGDVVIDSGNINLAHETPVTVISK